MAYFRLLAVMDEEIQDELLLFSCYKNNSNSGDAFNFDELSAEACKKLFRFEKDDIPNLCTALHWVPQILFLAYPSRLSDLKSVLGRSETAMSIIIKINTTLNFVYDAHNHLLHDLNSNWLSHRHLQEYADAVAARDAPLLNCWGFIDGTVRPLCRPTTNQRILFNGNKRVHAIKFQSIVASNVANMYGPIEGRRHDAGLLRESGICGELQTQMTTPTGDIYVIYGDPAYPMTTHIIKPFRGGVISAAQARFNKKMSALRTCVEWTFGKILTLFAIRL
ncbi:unnamed protein product [Mytilus coruscus]|uniref:DDE Tnp4 domain-containing protein n=1 Tax=Mytilus coruscus TaxID=42192 RepID=A0A6J8BMY1_MYTCO|nr:unnamed protein product [Mytilus coruscus]